MIRRKTIASHVPPGAVEPDALRALRSLGYEIVAVGPPSAKAGQELQSQLRIVDEEGLGQIAEEASAPVPVILLTREPAPLPADRRVIACLTRPAPFQELYAAIQKALEPTPRRRPRITTALPARCAYGDRTCTGVVISLSEDGCLLRNPEELPWEREVDLQFPLPRAGLISTRARQVRRSGTDLSLEFQDLSPASRLAISQYVMDRLTEDS
jgi:hypothetical protein